MHCNYFCSLIVLNTEVNVHTLTLLLHYLLSQSESYNKDYFYISKIDFKKFKLKC